MNTSFKVDSRSLFLNFKRATEITAEDMRYLLERQKTRVLERTARGVDLDSRPFAPYNKTRPYYYYPGKNSKNSVKAARRKAKQLGGEHRGRAVRFASYDAFKKALGRSVVDLTGPSAPHMLQTVVVKVSDSQGPQKEGSFGIYGPTEAVTKADAHNFGRGRMPQREFIGFGAGDERMIGADLEDLLGKRLSIL